MNRREQGTVCRLCGARDLWRVEELSGLSCVTSDCRPCAQTATMLCCPECGAVQKWTDASWHRAVRDIYASYAPYHQAGGNEQRVFDASGGSSVRSQRFLEHVLEQVAAGKHGHLLDVGCGNGGLLESMHRLRPGWGLSGFEPGEAQCGAVLSRPGAEQFYSGSLHAVQERFDLVTAVHVLEHVEQPDVFLREIVSLLVPGGVLAVEVPDWTQNPFDLLIFDHCTHFEAGTLAQVAARAGLSGSISVNVIPKEVSAIFHPGQEPPVAVRPAPESALAGARRAGRLLTQMSKLARAASETTPCGIFGTAIAGTWLAGELGERAAFFVDEDPARVGRPYLGRPVYAPDDIAANVPAGSVVMLPLAPAVAAAVGSRLERYAPHFTCLAISTMEN